VVHVAARSGARQVPEPVRELPGGLRIESRRGQVPGREVPHRLSGDVPFARVPARTIAAGGAMIGHELRRGRLMIRPLIPVLFMRPGAVETGIPDQGAVAKTPASADA